MRTANATKAAMKRKSWTLRDVTAGRKTGGEEGARVGERVRMRSGRANGASRRKLQASERKHAHVERRVERGPLKALVAAEPTSIP